MKQHARLYRISTRTVDLLDKLDFFYNVVIAALFVRGLVSLVIDEPPTVVSAVLGKTWFAIWIVLHVLAPVAIWIGQSASNPRFHWWMRWTGDCVVVGIAVTYVIALDEQAHHLSYLLEFLWFQWVLVFIAVGIATRDLLKALTVSNACGR